MNQSIKYIYFLGIGGIGMSNLARYFLTKGVRVLGYDRTSSQLTRELEQEGAIIHHHDTIEQIPVEVKENPQQTLIVITPAISDNSLQKNFFVENNYQIMKRAQLLGQITKHSKALCCAGTHGKTTTSAMLAHILRESTLNCNAFLGGILKNYNTNLLLDEKSRYTVIEADEYDRSFHWLHPYMALITSTDPDHLDIYHTEEEYLHSFEHFTSLINEQGALVVHKHAKLALQTAPGVRIYSYCEEEGDFHAKNIRIGQGTIIFDFVTPTHTITDINLGVPMKINIENSIGAMALAYLNGVSDQELKKAMASFSGTKRRFDFLLKLPRIVFVDDYAHHPAEIKASISSIKALYPDKKLTGVFQPHLYSRTRDFVDDFAESLSLLDELILLEIYPARELPIPGVSSQIILEKLSLQKKTLCSKEQLLEVLEQTDIEVLITMGAGDIDTLLQDIKQHLVAKYS